MGIFDRLAGTLDELTGDRRAAIDADVARARARAGEGDAAGAEEALLEITRRMPDAAAAFRALGELRTARGALDEAVAPLGRAVDLEAGDAAAWCALGETLAGLGRVEPAQDALRRTLALSIEAPLRARALLALGEVHGGAGRLTQAARELRQAIELAEAAGADDRPAAREYGRVLARLDEPEASAWLTRAARAEAAEPALFAEAAAATPDDARAEALLRDGLERGPGDVVLRAALIALLGRTRRREEALSLADATTAEAPEDARAWASARQAAAEAGLWTRAVEAAAHEAALGAPPPFAVQLALALGSGAQADADADADNRSALAALATEQTAELDPATGALRAALAAFVAGAAGEDDLVRLGGIAPDDPSRRFVARAGAPTPPPEGQLAPLLAWAHALASATPALAALAPSAARAAEAFDRPLLIAVMGEFNAGKSSFVNALCGAEVAPTGVTPTTATINVLRYGERPEARVIHQDGTARDVPAADVAAFLGRLGDDGARDVRAVEIFLPVESLRRIEVVDTPGLNSIRPEHERVARDFLRDADAIIWIFAAGQAAKATEREALGLARAAGKRVVGVLNKIDRAEPAEVAALVRHVTATLGDLVDAVVPFSATLALAARRAARPDPGFDALTALLEERFLNDARALKRATALAALARFVVEGRAAAPPPATEDLNVARTALGALRLRLQSAVDGERIALGARIEEGYRRAAPAVREFIQPRAWLFGEHRATPADEAFLGELLEDAVLGAVEKTRGTLRAAIDQAGALPDTPPTNRRAAEAGERAEHTIADALDHFAAYAHGFIEGGAVPDFFRHQLPRLRLDLAAIRDALLRRAPAPEEALFAGLRRALDAVFADAARTIEAAARDAALRALVFDARIAEPLAALERAVGALGG